MNARTDPDTEFQRARECAEIEIRTGFLSYWQGHDTCVPRVSTAPDGGASVMHIRVADEFAGRGRGCKKGGAVNNNTRRHPRTLQEAWGPYTSNELQPMRDRRPVPAHEIALYIVSAIALIVLVALPFLKGNS